MASCGLTLRAGPVRLERIWGPDGLDDCVAGVFGAADATARVAGVSAALDVLVLRDTRCAGRTCARGWT